jgi:hypothetical protein
MAVQCGTVTVLCCVTLRILVFGVCYGSAVWHGYSAVLCDTVYIGIGVCYGSAVWQGYSAVLCDTVYIGIWCVMSI